MSYFTQERHRFLNAIVADIVRTNTSGVPNFADTSSKPSSDIATELLARIGGTPGTTPIVGQRAGVLFEERVREFVEQSFSKLEHIRPGRWRVDRKEAISNFDQYEHLNYMVEATKNNPQLAAVLGRDYVIAPDVVVYRYPVPDQEINNFIPLVDANSANRAVLRESNGAKPILHASISCKWTIRSDRSQNSRTEALNLIRSRKGRVPHIAVVTSEPTPNRIASIALGTGDIDCTYHMALYELRDAIDSCGYLDALELLDNMIEGRRLRDISDLPLDLAT